MNKLEKILDFFPLNLKDKKHNNQQDTLLQDFQSYHFFKKRLQNPVSMWKWSMLPMIFLTIHFASVFLQHQPALSTLPHFSELSGWLSSFIYFEEHYLKVFFITFLFFRGLAALGNPNNYRAEKMALTDFFTLIAIGFPYAFFSLIFI
jgi:hypothetical protein